MMSRVKQEWLGDGCSCWILKLLRLKSSASGMRILVLAGFEASL